MNRGETLDPKALELAHEAAEAAYMAEEREGFAFDGAVDAAITVYLANSQGQALDIDALAQEIRRVDGKHDLGAGQLAEALASFIRSLSTPIAAGGGEATERFKRQVTYSCDLQRIIEDLCNDREITIPETTARFHYDMAVAYRADLSPCRIGEETEALTYGQKLIAEAIQAHFGERVEDYDEEARNDTDDTSNHDVWEAFEALRASLARKTTGEAELTPMSGFLVFLKDMRFTGSWDLPTLNRAIEVGETIIAQALAFPPPLPDTEEKAP